MKLVKNISFILVLGTVITLFANLLESKFLFKYLKDNSLGLLLTLLAINTATLGVVASKMQDIVVKYPKFDFTKTIREMKFSLKEQIFLIATSLFTLLISDSSKILFQFKEHICNIILVSVLVYSIEILWDTGKAVFVVIEELQKMKE